MQLFDILQKQKEKWKINYQNTINTLKNAFVSNNQVNIFDINNKNVFFQEEIMTVWIPLT